MDNVLGKRLKQLRTENNLTQEEFGKPYNIKKSTVSQYESGSSRPDDELKKRIANDFNVSLDWLMGKSDIKETAEDLLSSITTNDKINNKIKENRIETIAAHFDDEEFTDDDLEDIKNFIEFMVAKKKK